MDRRQFLTAMAVAGAAQASFARAQGGPASGTFATPKDAARDAWLWGLPLIEMAQQRSERSAEGVKINTFQHQRALITAKDQFVTTPNNDTLYSQAWLNLEKGPVTISVPASGTRYYCVPLMDMYSNNFAIIGTRTSGGSARTFTVIGPNDATIDPLVIRSPTNWVWVLGRTLVDDESDLPKARAFQDGWSIRGPEAAAPKTYAKRSAPWDEYFASVQDLMNESPPPMTDARMLDSMSPLLQLGRKFDPSRFSSDQVAEIRAGIAEAAKVMGQARALGLVKNGWTYSRVSYGNFGQDYDLRAAVALSGLAALPRAETMYMRAVGEDGRGLDSAKSWRLTFQADELPPADAFWSLSMYRVTPENQLFFAPNAINRYSIGDRTAGLKRGTDGSIDIVISRTEPTSYPNANWLPAPSDAKFVVNLRAYLPKAALIEGRYQVPKLQPI